ncbi:MULTISPECIES: hypothetical protein [unclassified Bradyrhizobium]|uniref:hypothetical protein n=1 Tax=unclassified Bradyrhizobium TaxID=2631580 RepID=UPI0029170888|nr:MULTISPECIES: hypothetical protein [unclassified Bradyrhizobium]
MAALLDNCRFIPTAGGTGDFTYASQVGGCQSPAAAGALNGVRYKLRAESSDLTQWELFEGAYTASTGTFARTTVLYNSAGTGAASGQSGAGTKINFSTVPQVAVVGLSEDLISIETANGFTAAQQTQARANIAAASTPAMWTRTVLTSGSGTYNLKAGCKALLVRMVGGGGGGGGGGGSPSGSAGSIGGATTFGSSFLAANGGNPGGGPGGAYSSGGGASGGDINLQGGYGAYSFGAGTSSGVAQGNSGGNSVFGGGGIGGWAGAGGAPGVPNTGGGGGGGGNSTNAFGGGGGAAGGYCEKLITNPAASYGYSVGAGGVGGAAGGSSGSAGGVGGAGIIIIDEYY